MSRPGVTYTDVVDAAHQLISEGKNPTIEQIRLKLGTGSSTTISHHLREWKDKLAGVGTVVVKDKLPDELVTIVKGLWDKVVDQSEAKVSVVESELQVKIADLEQQIQKYKLNNQRWQKLYQQLLLDKQQLTRERNTLIAKNDDLQHRHGDLIIKNEVLVTELLEKKTRIDELHEWHQQTRRHLDGNKAAMQQERVAYQKFSDSLHAQLQVMRNKLMSVEKKNKLLQHAQLRTNQQQANLIHAHELEVGTLTAKLADVTRALHALQEREYDAVELTLQPA